MERLFSSNAILEKNWEITRNLGFRRTKFLNPTISKFCRSFCMVVALHNSEILLIPATAFLPQNFKILPTYQLEFFWVSNPTEFCFAIGRNYTSTIYYKAPPIVSITPLHTRFLPGFFVAVHEILYYQPSFSLIRFILKK